MELHKMQDIAGIRIVCKNLDTVYKVKKVLEVEQKNTKNKIIRTKCYIQEARNTGYRGIHMIYSYSNPDNKLNKYLTELQIRTNRQHAWAMAVELASFILKEDLKSGKGNKDWLNFFKKISDLFYSKDTGSEIDKKTLTEAKKLYDALNVSLVLRSCINAITHSSNELKINKDIHSVLIYMTIKDKKSQTRLAGYSKSQYIQAVSEYGKIETDIINNKNKNNEHVVLVRVGTAVFKDEDLQNNIKNAFPSFFTDADIFIKEVDNVLKNNTQYANV